tara:strand:- start:352 stop:666 length:315 start_codon:yes stop_codon:yes gene_type:complete
MKLLTLLYVFALFYVFIPGNIIKLPLKTTKFNLVLIHGLLFSSILYFSLPIIEKISVLEGYGGSGDGHEVCNSEHLDNCKNETDCLQNGGVWQDEKCNSLSPSQ